ncbi:hypothetical protein [Dactylosporangium sp. CA-139066]|uniref:hypothetical protein n=1 Tax=Dactylosporangium sp. CA-139066 TaxID=3239930 RepID=UPI003D8F08EA
MSGRLRICVMALAVLVATLTSGCQHSKPQENMDLIAEQIQNDLQVRPDVTKAEVTYQNTLDAYQLAFVNIDTKPGADLDALMDEGFRLVWLSRLQPLSEIQVWVSDAAQHHGDHRSAGKEDFADLTAKYGKRPV